MKSWLLLDVVVRKSSTVLKLFSGEDQSLLIWWDTFLILDFSFDVFDCVRGFNIKSYGLSGQGLDENLHTTSQSQHQVKGWFLLDIVVRKSSSVFELFSSEDKSLLIWRDTFLVLDFSFNVFDGIRWFNIKSDGLSG